MKYYVLAFVAGVGSAILLSHWLQRSPAPPHLVKTTFSSVLRKMGRGGYISEPGGPPPQLTGQRADCQLPGMPDTAIAALLSANRGGAVSSLSIGSPDVAVSSAAVNIAAGEKPLYIVAVAGRAMIWRFTGAVGRVRHLVLASTATQETALLGKRPLDAAPLVAETGIAASRVTMLRHTDCIRPFSQAPSIEAASAGAMVWRHTGRMPDVILATEIASSFAIPNGDARSAKPNPATNAYYEIRALIRNVEGQLTRTSANMAELSRDVAQTYPDGVAEIDPHKVVASGPAEPYQVLPDVAGLLQLVKSGALTRNSAGQYFINRQMRYPADLMWGTTFLLRKDVPEPTGAPGRACTVSQSTGEVISPSPFCH